MTTLQLLFIIAAFIAGWVGIDMFGAIFTTRFPVLSNLGVGFISDLAMYNHLFPIK